MPVVSFGLWTTVQSIAAEEPSSACASNILGICNYNSSMSQHASWLNQVEIYFPIVQRKVLTPNDFSDLDAPAERLLVNTTENPEPNRSSGIHAVTRQNLKDLSTSTIGSPTGGLWHDLE
jgi:hypothetical protein